VSAAIQIEPEPSPAGVPFALVALFSLPPLGDPPPSPCGLTNFKAVGRAHEDIIPPLCAFGEKENHSRQTSQSLINEKCIVFIIIAACNVCSGFMQVCGWSVAGERQSKRLKERYVRADLRRDMCVLFSPKKLDGFTLVEAEVLS